jgi:hypothetical protein
MCRFKYISRKSRCVTGQKKFRAVCSIILFIYCCLYGVNAKQKQNPSVSLNACTAVYGRRHYSGWAFSCQGWSLCAYKPPTHKIKGKTKNNIMKWIIMHKIMNKLCCNYVVSLVGVRHLNPHLNMTLFFWIYWIRKRYCCLLSPIWLCNVTQ